MHYRYEAHGAIDADITLAMGELVVTADDVDTITVDVTPTKADRPADVRAAENTEVDFASGRLTVTQKRESLISTWVNKGWSIDVNVRVPKRSRIQAKSANGNIRVFGLIGPSSLTASYGDITAGDVAELNAKTAYGDVVVERVSGATRLTGTTVRVGEVYGEATVKCTQGSISTGLVMGRLEAVSAQGRIDVRTLMGELDARSAHGKIRIDEAVSGAATLSVSHGDIQVGIRKGSLTWLDLDSKQGAVRNELDALPEAPADDAASDQLRVTARAGYGSVRVFRAVAG